LRRNVSRSSAELTVIVHTVFGSARATKGQMPATKAARSRAVRCGKGMDKRIGRKKTRQYYTSAAENG